MIIMVIWFIGKSASGKTYYGSKLYETLRLKYNNIVFLDGDLLRNSISSDLGHSIEDRYISEDRRSKLSKILSDQGIHVIVSGISNEPEIRAWNKNNIKNYLEIYLDINDETLYSRDPKGLYAEYSQGIINNVVGKDIKFHVPIKPWMTIVSENSRSVKQTIGTIIIRLKNEKILS